MIGRRTKIVKFLGGLGNQMFQYAFLLSLQQQFGKVKADLSGFRDYRLHHGFELAKVFGIELEQASPLELRLYTSEDRGWLTRKLRRIYGTKGAEYFEREDFGYDPNIYRDTAPRYYWGYWQHYKYIQSVDQQLRKAFQFVEVFDGKSQLLVQQLRFNASIAVHVRRGDYLGHPLLGGICDQKYYQLAIQVMKERVKNPLFVFFSNDMAWCRDNLQVDNAVYVDWNQGDQSYRDMQLMSCCDHYIIANSSFSWWGAWLNPAEEKLVISPNKWAHTNADASALIHPNWIQL